MKITDTYGWRGDGKQYSLRDALDTTLTDSDTYGQLETLAREVSALQRMVATLVVALTENGKLTDRNLMNLLEGRFKVEF